MDHPNSRAHAAGMAAGTVGVPASSSVLVSPREKDFLGPEDIAGILGVSLHTVRAWRRRGYLPPAIKLGKLLRWPRTAIQAWIADHQEGRANKDDISLQWKGQALQKRGNQ